MLLTIYLKSLNELLASKILAAESRKSSKMKMDFEGIHKELAC
jgi:hypothetical protein